ncbi:MAG: hypothetical protein MUC66_04930 [Methanolinea sp.]|jgi:hypothetical protein|nr:hypothetical protein [Methanolinea sp.]
MKKYTLLILALAIFTVGTAMADYIPAYSNVAEMGSSFTGSRVSMVTTASQNPVGMDYSVSLSGVGTASAWINAHLMEGRTGIAFPTGLNGGTLYSPFFYNPDTGGISPNNGFMQGTDLVYKEKTTASGIIKDFSKTMSIQMSNSGSSVLG